MNHYESIIQSIKFTQQEQEIITEVKSGIQSDQQKSPWNDDKWYKGFTKANEDGISLLDAPLNKPLMVVTDRVGTLIKNDRGQALDRGSILIKLSNTEIYAIDSTSWYGSPSKGAITYTNNGLFTIRQDQAYGKVKEIKDVVASTTKEVKKPMKTDHIFGKLVYNNKIIGVKGIDSQGNHVDIEIEKLKGIKPEVIKGLPTIKLIEHGSILASPEEIADNNFAYDGSNNPDIVRTALYFLGK